MDSRGQGARTASCAVTRFASTVHTVPSTWTQPSITNLTVDFSWKPEIFDPRDVDAFESRFCRRPPDLLVASKGLHDAAFYEFSGNETEWRITYEAGLRRWLSLLRCLHGTQIIWRSPDLPTRQPREAALVILTESVARRAFRAGEFGGEAYLVGG